MLKHAHQTLARDFMRFGECRASGVRALPTPKLRTPYGAETIGEVFQYEDKYRLCYVRGPAGIIIALAEELF